MVNVYIFPKVEFFFAVDSKLKIYYINHNIKYKQFSNFAKNKIFSEYKYKNMLNYYSLSRFPPRIISLLH